jgi:hypothetical protein
VWLLIDNNNYIAGFSTRIFIRFTVEYILLTMGCTLINLGFNDLSLLDYLLTIAFLALVLLGYS